MLERMKEDRKKLATEFAKGQQALEALQKQTSSTVATMQRIQGAMQFIDTQVAELASEQPKKDPKLVKNDSE